MDSDQWSEEDGDVADPLAEARLDFPDIVDVRGSPGLRGVQGSGASRVQGRPGFNRCPG